MAAASGAPGTGTSAAAAADVFALLLLSDEEMENGNDNGQKCNGDENGGKIGTQPDQHGNHSFDSEIVKSDEQNSWKEQPANRQMGIERD